MDNEEVTLDAGEADEAEVLGELLQLLAYPENVVDLPELQVMQAKSLLSKSSMVKFKKEIFTTVCCMTCTEVGRKGRCHNQACFNIQ
jgi:hypothetical protein